MTTLRTCLLTIMAVGILAGPALAMVPAVPPPADPNDIRNVLARAEKGDAAAQLQAGLDYLIGQDGAESDAYAAMHWFKLSADQGNARAKEEYDELKAGYDDFLTLRAKALTGDAAAEAAYDKSLNSWVTGYMRFDHTTSPHNWFRRAAEQGNADGEYGMGYDAYWAWVFHEQGKPEPMFEEDPLTADLTPAFDWLNKAAAQDQTDAAALLARLYGLDTPYHDDALAKHWLETAAPSSEEAEGASCQLDYDGTTTTYHLVIFIDRKPFRITATPDYDKAFACFTAYTARSDKAAAMSDWYLGEMYHLGRGVAQDDRQAVDLLTLAADKDPDQREHRGLADLELARIYAASRAVPHDLVKAYRLYGDALKILLGQTCGDRQPQDAASLARLRDEAAVATTEQDALRKRMSAKQLRDAVPPVTPPVDCGGFVE